MEASRESSKCKCMANLAQSGSARANQRPARPTEGAESRLRRRACRAVAALLLAALPLVTPTASALGGVAPVGLPAPLSLAADANQGETCEESACLPLPRPGAYPAESQQLLHWRAAGIHFEGPWHPDEVALILKVLDRFAATFGEAQVLALIQLGLSADPHSEVEHLTFTRVSDHAYPPGSWSPRTGEILIKDSLYDQAFIDAQYAWVFFEVSQLREAHQITREEVIVAHELGHVLVDGMRMRRDLGGIGAPLGDKTAPLGRMWLEELYAEQLNINYWPHPFRSTNENLATEVGVWALGLPRQQVVVAFREKYLRPLIYGRVIVASR